MRKPRTECCFCGLKCDGKIKIRYLPPLETWSPCCADCFGHWKGYEDKYLIKKVREKLLGGKDA